MNPAKIIEEWGEKNGTITIGDGRITVQGNQIIQITFSKHSPPLHDILFYRIVVYPPDQGIYFYYYHHGDPNSYFDDNSFLSGMNTLTFEQFSDVMRERHPEFLEWVVWNLL
jgi:hypothetical protein